MAFTPAFSVSQTIDPTSFTITDNSVGSDGSIAARYVFLQLSDGTYLTPSGSLTDYISFPLSLGSSIDIIGLLVVDYAVSIKLQWLNNVGAVLYELSQSYCFVGNDEQFMYGLVQFIASNKGVLQDTSYVNNCFRIDMFTTFAQKSVETGNDIANAQDLLDYAQDMVNNQDKYF
jgi:hypothetical protein